MLILAYAVPGPAQPLEPTHIERRPLGAEDILIEILFCGVCHTDVSFAQGHLPGARFPLVPGHEIVGRVTAVGSSVVRFRQGDVVGVGCMVDSCRACAECSEGLEQFCDGMVATYSGVERDGVTPTFGGYSSHIVVDEHFVVRVPPALSPAHAAPLLCAGITSYSPLRHWRTGPGSRVAVLGLGGLGHLAVKMAVAMGAEVTVISRGEHKREDAMRFGARDYVPGTDAVRLGGLRGRFDLVLNTTSGNIDNDLAIGILRRDGTLVHLGVPDDGLRMQVFDLLLRRKKVAGSPIGSIAETQEMLDFCVRHGIGAEIELIDMGRINEAHARVVANDVRYRFVIDMRSLR